MEEKKENKEIHSKRIPKEEMEEITKKINEKLQRFIKEGKYGNQSIYCVTAFGIFSDLSMLKSSNISSFA